MDRETKEALDFLRRLVGVYADNPTGRAMIRRVSSKIRQLEKKPKTK